MGKIVMTFRHLSRTVRAAAVMSAMTMFTATATPALAQDDAALSALDAAIPGTLLHNPYEANWDAGGNDIRSKVIDAEGLASGQAISTRIKKRQDKPWDSYLRFDVPQAINKGDKIQVIYWARTAKAPKGSERAKVSMYLGRNVDPYDNVFAKDFEPNTEWEMKSFTGTATSNFPAGSVKLEYQLGKAKQTVEFGPVYVSRLN
jgi:hypothetical protein